MEVSTTVVTNPSSALYGIKGLDSLLPTLEAIPWYTKVGSNVVSMEDTETHIVNVQVDGERVRNNEAHVLKILAV